MIKRIVSRIFAICLVLAALSLTGCQSYRDLKVHSFDIESLSPKSLRSITLKATAVVYNPSAKLQLSNISGSIMKNGREIGTLSANPLTIDARSERKYDLDCNVALAPSASAMDVLFMRPEDCTVNFSCKIKTGGVIVRKVKYENIPVEKLIKALGK